MKKFSVLLLSTFLVGCDPISLTLCGGGAGALASREKGISGAISDSKLAMVVKAEIYKYNSYFDSLITVIVQNSEVFLIGQLPNAEEKAMIEKIVWRIEGVIRVINEISIDPEKKLSDTCSDSVITGKIKSSMLFKPEIRSLNYSIKTVQGVVYITGVSQDENEREKVSDIARSTPGVKKVVCYTNMKKK